jgi:hypothetical protein
MLYARVIAPRKNDQLEEVIKNLTADAQKNIQFRSDSMTDQQRSLAVLCDTSLAFQDQDRCETSHAMRATHLPLFDGTAYDTQGDLQQQQDTSQSGGSWECIVAASLSEVNSDEQQLSSLRGSFDNAYIDEMCDGLDDEEQQQLDEEVQDNAPEDVPPI